MRSDAKLLDVFFASEEVGWVAGGAGEISGGAILYTEDSGKNWVTQYGDFQSSDRAVNMLRFIDPHTGWAVQGTGGGDSQLLHTIDGKNWTQSPGSRAH